MTHEPESHRGLASKRDLLNHGLADGFISHPMHTWYAASNHGLFGRDTEFSFIGP